MTHFASFFISLGKFYLYSFLSTNGHNLLNLKKVWKQFYFCNLLALRKKYLNPKIWCSQRQNSRIISFYFISSLSHIYFKLLMQDTDRNKCLWVKTSWYIEYTYQGSLAFTISYLPSLVYLIERRAGNTKSINTRKNKVLYLPYR